MLLYAVLLLFYLCYFELCAAVAALLDFNIFFNNYCERFLCDVLSVCVSARVCVCACGKIN